MARPLQVYLDSSDFSNLANPNASDLLRSVERYLLTWLDAGLIEIRFSHLHVVEASPVRPEDISFSKARLAKIKQLCERKCLRSTISIIEKEIASPGAWRAPDYLDWVFLDDGNWFPNIVDVDTDMSPIAALRDEIRTSGLDRATRRKREREWFDSYGRLKPAVKARLRRTRSDEMQQLFPLPAGAAQEISDLIIDGADKAVISSKLAKAIGQDISLWPGWYEKHWDRVAPISTLLRSGSRGINDGFRNALDVMKREYVEWHEKGIPIKELDLIAERTFNEAASKMHANIVRRLSTKLDITPYNGDCDDPWELRPGLTTALSVQRQSFKRAVGFAGLPRKPDEGDLGDVLHCVHLPFVDFFRADGFAASMIAEVKPPFPTKIVPKLAHLPELIRARLDQDER
jgi:hypothetical protein